MQQKTYYTIGLHYLTGKEKEEYKKRLLEENKRYPKLEAEYAKARTLQERASIESEMAHCSRVCELISTTLYLGYEKYWYPLPERK